MIAAPHAALNVVSAGMCVRVGVGHMTVLYKNG